MTRNEFKEFTKQLPNLSDNDLLRLAQCVFCGRDPGTCGCTEKNEDSKGMCKRFTTIKDCT